MASSEINYKLLGVVIISLVFTVANAMLVAQSMSRPLFRLTGASKHVEAGTLSEEERLALANNTATDEIGQLSRTFAGMVVEVHRREETLKQQVMKLRIVIDETKKAQEVAEIVNTDYFQNLQRKAQELRQKTQAAAQTAAPAAGPRGE